MFVRSNIMYAEYLPDETLVVSGTQKAEKFNKMWAGIGWPDLDDGYICVVGERVDSRYHCIWEKLGGLWELGSSAIDAKDRLLVDRIWVDARDEISTSYFRTLDGLCFYDEDDSHVLLEPQQASSKWEHFRDLDTVATVVPVPERITSNYRSALEMIRGVIAEGKLMIHEQNCPRLVYALRQPLEDLLRSPVMKALVWVVSALEESNGIAAVGSNVDDSWYKNIPRPTK
jgi:hypothetical protein